MGYGENVTELIGKTLVEVINGNDEVITFKVDDGSVYELYHSQSCCESVYVEDIIGDLNNLVGSPIVMAEEVSNSETHPEDAKLDYEPDCFEWTFYKFATLKGYVTIRWYGTSNGYYSMSVSFIKVG